MTTDLKAAHADLLHALIALEQALARDVPDRVALASARWKLSKASGHRRRLLAETIYPQFERSGDGGAARIADLRRQDRDMSAASARHIAKWTLEAVLEDWAGYRAASAVMREAMRTRIATEQAVLYPMLESA